MFGRLGKCLVGNVRILKSQKRIQEIADEIKQTLNLSKIKTHIFVDYSRSYRSFGTVGAKKKV